MMFEAGISFGVAAVGARSMPSARPDMAVSTAAMLMSDWAEEYRVTWVVLGEHLGTPLGPDDVVAVVALIEEAVDGDAAGGGEELIDCVGGVADGDGFFGFGGSSF